MRYFFTLICFLVFMLFSIPAFAAPQVPEVAVAMAFDAGANDATDPCMACQSSEINKEINAGFTDFGQEAAVMACTESCHAAGKQSVFNEIGEGSSGHSTWSQESPDYGGIRG